MDNENYINIQGWMRTALGLTGNRLMVYAIVYGFCQDGVSSFTGGYKYIMDWCGCSKDTARRLLKSMTEEGLLIREDQGKEGRILQTYRVAKCDGLQIATGSKLQEEGSQNATGTGSKMQPININNNINIKSNNNISSRFDFFAALKGIGVTDEVARAWMQVRSKKKATNTKIAFDRVKNEIAKSGRSADDCIRYAVEKSWQGFEAAWLPATARKYESFEETMARLGIK